VVAAIPFCAGACAAEFAHVVVPAPDIQGRPALELYDCGGEDDDYGVVNVVVSPHSE